jgi:hypothetical protein
MDPLSEFLMTMRSLPQWICSCETIEKTHFRHAAAIRAQDTTLHPHDLPREVFRKRNGASTPLLGHPSHPLAFAGFVAHN